MADEQKSVSCLLSSRWKRLWDFLSFAGAILRIVKEVLECDPLCETYSVIVETEIVSFVLITQNVGGTCLSWAFHCEWPFKPVLAQWNWRLELEITLEKWT